MRLLALSENTKEFFRQQKESGTSLESEYPQIPWKEIIRFREKLAHHYEGIDYDLVWEIVENDLPPLLDTIKKLLKNKKQTLPCDFLFQCRLAYGISPTTSNPAQLADLRFAP
eukprot:TRINITY_DN125056_c0_g1_i1.p2 TRINITY_DN125056_c0_g1~~TRINITY_DN125056_c0_g1_i1.p2  ORF type:complete len:113 (-),score=4.93 TRINITY_DN125056_c0_g1_i1:13-351(-)